MEQLRNSIKFLDVSELNDKIVGTQEEETADLKFYKNMLEFTFN